MVKREDLISEDVESEVEEQLAISSDLTQEFASQAAYFARWAFLHARAQDTVRAMEERVEVSFYELYNEYRGEHSDAKENECKSYVRTHKRHQGLTSLARKAQFQADILKATVRAFEIRRDMLIQLGADKRSELEGTDLKTKASRATKVVRDSIKDRRRKRHGDQEED